MTGGKPRADPPTDQVWPLIGIVEDDSSVREGLSSLFRSVGYDVAAFGSGIEYLRDGAQDAVRCLVVDVRLPGMSGLEFQAQLARLGIATPIIFVTGHGDVPMSVRAMKSGAVDFLVKPFRDQDVLDAVAAAIERDQHRRDGDKAAAGVRVAFASLTAREREVMALVTAGLINKQIAGRIGLSEITVKIHRGHVMQKMGAKSLADLVRMADALDLGSSGGRAE